MRLSTAITTWALAAIIGTPVLKVGADDASIVLERQEGFETMGRAFKAMRAMQKDGAADNPRFVDAAEAIAERSKLIADWFPAGTGIDDGADTDALNYIWKNAEKFARLTADIEIEAEGLVAAARSGDVELIASAIESTRGACSACHKSFRAD
ncbi:MAG: cytochrome c [Pseudomonadota bacterium]